MIQSLLTNSKSLNISINNRKISTPTTIKYYINNFSSYRKKFNFQSSPTTTIKLKRSSAISRFQSLRFNNEFYFKQMKFNNNNNMLQHAINSNNASFSTLLIRIQCYLSGSKISENLNDYEKSSKNLKSKKRIISNLLGHMKSLPTIITMSRIACTPIVSYFIITETYDVALLSCLAFGVLDYTNRNIVKKYNMTTVFGTFLDPLADKIMINTLTLSLCYNGILPTTIVIMWLGRDILLIGAKYCYMQCSNRNSDTVVHEDFLNPRKANLKVQQSSFNIKCFTVLQFMTLSCGMIYPILNIDHHVVLGLWHATTKYSTRAKHTQYGTLILFF